MSRFEYLIPLVSIFVGLALADLLASLHRLLMARDRVRWHGLPLVWAALAFFLALRYWWAFFYVGQAGLWEGYFAFALHLLTSLVPLYLLTAAALPDDVPEAGLDLLAFHLGHRRYFFALVALYLVGVLLDAVVRNGFTADVLPAVGVVAPGLGLAAVLAVSGRPRVHAVGTLLFVGLTVVFFTVFAVRLGPA